MLNRFSCGLPILISCAIGCTNADSDSKLGGLGNDLAGAGGGALAGSGGVAALAGIGGSVATGAVGGAGSGSAVTTPSSGSGGSAGGAATSGSGGGGPGGAGSTGAGSGGAAGAAMAGAGMAGAGGAVDGAPVMSKGCGAVMAPRSDTYTIDVAGTERTYILKVPDDYDASDPHRLILSFHWLGGTAKNVADGDFYGLAGMSKGSTIFAAPQGIENRWSDPGHSRTSGGDDIAFTMSLVEELTSKLCIDESRIFAEGFSMGGSMSYAVACAMPDVVRAVVAHSGGPMSGCVEHDKPVAYFMTHGTEDSVCTYPEYGVPQLNDFAMVNGCMPHDMPTPSGSAHECVDFEGCMKGYPARACIFVGPHTPSPPGNWVPGESWAFISQF
jgi:poly(3-hydroxybutyrate) depolymerase